MERRRRSSHAPPSTGSLSVRGDHDPARGTPSGAWRGSCAGPSSRRSRSLPAGALPRERFRPMCSGCSSRWCLPGLLPRGSPHGDLHGLLRGATGGPLTWRPPSGAHHVGNPRLEAPSSSQRRSPRCPTPETPVPGRRRHHGATRARHRRQREQQISDPIRPSTASRVATRERQADQIPRARFRSVAEMNGAGRVNADASPGHCVLLAAGLRTRSWWSIGSAAPECLTFVPLVSPSVPRASEARRGAAHGRAGHPRNRRRRR